MKYAPLLALLLVGCSDMAVSPVAPSATAPAGATTPIVPPSLPRPVPIPVPNPPPQELPPQPVAPPVSVLEFSSVARIGGTATAQEWGFASSSSSDVTDFAWDFGDGDGAASGRRVEQHVYRGMAGETRTVTVRLSARGASGALTTTRTITLTFK